MRKGKERRNTNNTARRGRNRESGKAETTQQEGDRERNSKDNREKQCMRKRKEKH